MTRSRRGRRAPPTPSIPKRRRASCGTACLPTSRSWIATWPRRRRAKSPPQKLRRPWLAVASFTSAEERLHARGRSRGEPRRHVSRLSVHGVAAPDGPEHYCEPNQKDDRNEVVQLELGAVDVVDVAEPVSGDEVRTEREDGGPGDPELGQDHAYPRAGVAAWHHERPPDVRVLPAQGEQRWEDEDVGEGGRRD